MTKFKPSNITFFFLLIFIAVMTLLFSSCTRRIPQIIYQDKVVSHTDTITVLSKKTDTIPCDDFIHEITNGKDTVYVKVVDKQMTVEYINKRDTVYRETIILQPAPLRSKINIDNSIDNSIKNKAKKGSAIGDGNKITTKKNNWWWIFLAGLLSWFIIQNVLLRFLKTYFPFLKIFF